ncbi:hypothetical protein ACIBQ1_61300 [Nonomuraea sp. NPDC050153]|uniref:hypothetical protein n=1 Tax=Nonomuraea sp. NPDC050153 TaxID=3364359 RepID=UPI0037A1D71A
MISRPPGWSFLTVVSVVALMSFYGTSVSMWHFEVIIFMSLTWGALILIWLACLVVTACEAAQMLTAS